MIDDKLDGNYNTMTTTTTTSTIRMVSNEERKALAIARIQAIRTRPTTVAAQEFFAGSSHRDWKSLPRRLRKLCDVLEAWVRTTYSMVSLAIGVTLCKKPPWLIHFFLFYGLFRMPKMVLPKSPVPLRKIPKNRDARQ